MNEKEQKRIAIYEDHIKQLRDAADDPALNKDWKLFCFREIFKALDQALAELEREAPDREAGTRGQAPVPEVTEDSPHVPCKAQSPCAR